MSTSHKDKSGRKPRQRGRKGEQRREPAEQAQSLKLEQRDDDQTNLTVASTDAPTNGAAAPVTNGAAAPVEAPLVGEVLPPIGATAPADRGSVTIRTIAAAYGDYTTRSFEEGTSFVAKLMGVRSLDKAIEVQTEFARQAYANFFVQSQRICELYGELAKQAFRPWERFAAKVTQGGRQIW
ncbi:MAG TPA: phasin family protein [Bradyrhizobium sp.]|nr:phasin family protein [Bradyrhizobium sp.]